MAWAERVDIGALLAGGRRHISIDRDVNIEPFEGLEFPKPAHVKLELHGAGDMLEITGTIDAAIGGECVRCLGELSREMHLIVDERLDAGSPAQADPFGESNVLLGDRLDVGFLAAQLVCSALPLGYLCSQECKGICPQCGSNLNNQACACAPVTSNGVQTWRT